MNQPTSQTPDEELDNVATFATRLMRIADLAEGLPGFGVTPNFIAALEAYITAHDQQRDKQLRQHPTNIPLKEHLQANLLDGESIDKGQMIAATEVYEWAAEYVEQLRERLVEERSLIRRDLDYVLELAEDDDPDSCVVDNLKKLVGHYLPKGHPDYWKHHCVGCGLWLHGEPEEEGYCQCE